MKILVVEDEKKIALAIKRGLEQEGFAVEVAYTGDEGLYLAQNSEYSLIIIDWMLPEKDGLALCEELRSKGFQTPILMLTAKSSLQDKVHGLTSGADDYLTKPFAFEELIARTHALIRRSPTLQSHVIQVGPLSININDYTVTRGEQNIQLSRTEYLLLELLCRHKNQVLTKDQIRDNVWSYDSDILPNTVEVYIGYLRNKIDRPFKDDTELIETVRGYGYRIREPKL